MRRQDLIIDQSTMDPEGSLMSEQRLRRRLKDEMTEKIDSLLAERVVTNFTDAGKVKVKIDLTEPSFRLDKTNGNPSFVVVGNPKYRVGDIISKDDPCCGSGCGCGAGAGDGEVEDDFTFTISSEELERRILEGLRLPNMQKRTLLKRRIQTIQPAGYRPYGPPATLDLVRSSSMALGRRVALKRPNLIALEDLKDQVEELQLLAEEDPARAALPAVLKELERANRKRIAVPYMDPMDLRFHRKDVVQEPVTAAVMFCEMDVSASMDEHMKDLAKRFFWLLRYFLKAEYKEVQVVYIRHTDTAQEVNEQEFFFGKKTGGTVVSSAHEKMLQIIKERYPLEQWNIYVCQAGDGDTMMTNHNEDDALVSAEMVQSQILPMVQYFAYLECHPERSRNDKMESDLWQAYGMIKKPSHFAMKKVSKAGEIYPVFRSLFTATDNIKEAA